MLKRNKSAVWQINRNQTANVLSFFPNSCAVKLIIRDYSAILQTQLNPRFLLDKSFKIFLRPVLKLRFMTDTTDKIPTPSKAKQ